MTPLAYPVNLSASALPFFSAPLASVVRVPSVLPTFLDSRGVQARPPFSRSQTSSCHLLKPSARHHKLVQNLLFDGVVTKAVAPVNR